MRTLACGLLLGSEYCHLALGIQILLFWSEFFTEKAIEFLLSLAQSTCGSWVGLSSLVLFVPANLANQLGP